jgi:hypothetical protein
MGNEARRHHYISQFYLKGFGKSGLKNPPITVINLHDKKYFTTTSNNLASIRDFNRINVPDLKADAIESALSDFEYKAAGAIREIHKTKKFEGESRALVLQLIAMFHSRNPAQRENTRDFMSRIFQTSSNILQRHDAEFKNKTEELASTLGADTSKMTTAELNQFIFEKTKLELSNEYHLHTEFIFIESIFNALNHRRWTLVQSSEQTGPIITSDNPVILTWNNPESVPALYRHSPGHAMPNTTVYFSLSQHLALIGTFDNNDATMPPNERLIAASNTMNIIYAHNQIYSPNFHFRLLNKNETIQDGDWFKGEFNLTKK